MSAVLILTAGYGEGHNAAARGLLEGFGEQAELLDLFGPAFGATYQKSRQDYIRIVNERPWLWSWIYQLLDRVPMMPVVLPFLRPLRREFKEVLVKHRPKVVVSVYPMYGYLIEEAAREAGIERPQSYTVVTDSITVNSVWYRCGSDGYLVPNEDTAEVMVAAGVSRDLVHIIGFPVSPRFAAEGPVRPEPSAEVLPRVLYMVNGQRGRVVPLVERVLRESKVELTVTVGKDEELKRELEHLARRMGRPLEVLGWVNDVPALLRRNHLLIGKAGGAMVQEALAARLPMIITQILPGQEEGNARLMIQNGCGVLCPTNEAVVQTVSELFSNQAIGWNRMVGHTMRLGRPNASKETVAWIQSRMAGTHDGVEMAFGVRGV